MTAGTNSTPFSTDGTTKVLKDGSEVPLSQLDGQQVRVLAEQQPDGSYLAKRVVSGKPPRPDFVRADGTLTKNNDGTITVDGKTFTVDAQTRVFKDGKKVQLSDLTGGTTVHVIGVKQADGTLVAKAVGTGQPPEGGPGRHHRGGPSSATSA